MDLISKMQDGLGMAVMLITHDLGVIAEQCDEVIVMYAGRIVERAPVMELFSNPLHAYILYPNRAPRQLPPHSS